MDDKRFNDLKKETFVSLISKDEDIKDIVTSSLLIGLCHDLCISDDDKLLVNEKFINDCASKIISVPSILISQVKKFSLIRNKLAHGDYAIDKENRKIIIEYGKEYFSISFDSIKTFAKEIYEYYDYIDAKFDRRNIVYTYGGYILDVTDHCKEKKERNNMIDIIIAF